jgi:ATP-dependent helicase/nuclease subunit B
VGGFFVPVASGDGNERSEDGLGALALRKARGIYDGRYYNYLDNSLEEGAKSSFYAMALKKDGGFNKNSSGDMLEEGQLDIVLDFARDKICEIADGIMSGDISAEPVNSNGRLACEYCDYRPLCRFDRLLNSSRLIRELSGDKKKAFFELTGEGSSL